MFKHIFFKPIFIGTIFLIAMTSCRYKPDGEYFRELNPNTTPPNLNIEIADHGDTIYLFSYESLTAMVHTNASSLLAMELSVDDSLCQVFPVYGGNEFNFNPATYCHKDGVYRLRLDVYTGTGTGSIAEHLGAEAFLFSREYILVMALHVWDIDLSLMYEDLQGSLKIGLHPYTNLESARTIITKSVDYDLEYDTVAVLDGISGLSATDPTYVGETARYSVKVYLPDKKGIKYFLYTSFTDTKNGSNVTPGIDMDEKGRPVISWRKNPYYANCGGYKIFTRRENESNVELLGTINTLNDTTFLVQNPTFPGYHEYRVAPFPKTLPVFYNDNTAWEYFGMTQYSWTGLPSFSYSRMYVPNGPYFYYDFGYSGSINRVSATDLTLEKEFQVPVAGGYFYTYKISPNDVYLLGICSASTYTMYFVNVTTQESVTFPAADIFGPGETPGTLSVSDNGIGALTAGSKLYAYNFINHSLVGSSDLPSDAELVSISPDGSYILIKSGLVRLYKVESSGLNLVWTSSALSGDITYLNFMPEDAGKALLFTDLVLTTFQCPQMSPVKTIPIPGDEISNIDFTTGRILSSNSTDFFINDLNSGVLMGTNHSKPYSIYNLRISKDAVYHNSGRKLIMF